MILAGVDEVGRGTLAGPVVVAAVVLQQPEAIPELTDSKALSAKKREELAQRIIHYADDFSIIAVDVEIIDRLNIHHATLLGMSQAIESLNLVPQKVMVDGKFVPETRLPVEAIIGGDALVPQISAASIIAKVLRDQMMVRYDAIYPGYGFAQHKAYATQMHTSALKKLGVCPIHRRSFAPVRDVLSTQRQGRFDL